MAGGFKTFGPTYNATKYVRVLHEGMINGSHVIDSAIVAAKTEELAGKIAAITVDGIGLSSAGAGAVGLITEDLGDMVNASLKASFYFRGGEYLVAESRLGATIDSFAVGDQLTTDANGGLIKHVAAVEDGTTGITTPENGKPVATVTSVGTFPMGNMFEWAGDAANGGSFLGFILHI